MSNYCKGRCEAIKFRKSYNGYYNDGAKFCKTCDVFLLHDGNYCPCCGMHLRNRSRMNKRRNGILIVTK